MPTKYGINAIEILYFIVIAKTGTILDFRQLSK